MPAAQPTGIDIGIGSVLLTVVPVEAEEVDEFLAIAEQVCADGGVALVRKPPVRPGARGSEGRPSLLEMQSIVESVGNCAAVPLVAVDGTVVGIDPILIRSRVFSPLNTMEIFPCLLGRTGAIRHVLSFADDVPPDEVVCRSRPARTDFQEFADLWTPAEIGTEPGPDVAAGTSTGSGRGAGEGAAFGYGVARMLATGHRNGALHGDAHRSNFGWLNGVVASFDMDDARILLRQPTSAQCATDLAPLLVSFSPSDWRAFRAGYLTTWPEGQRVIDLIECGDTTGWRTAMAAQDFSRAAGLLDEALDGCRPGDDVQLMVLRSNRARVRSKLGRHTEACEDAEAALSTGALVEPNFVPLLGLHVALARVHAGQPDRAVRTLLALIVAGAPPAVSAMAMRLVEHLYSTAAAPAPTVPDDEVPFLVRQGRRVVGFHFPSWNR